MESGEQIYRGYKIYVGLCIQSEWEADEYESYVYDLKTGEIIDGGNGFESLEEAEAVAKSTVDRLIDFKGGE